MVLSSQALCSLAKIQNLNLILLLFCLGIVGAFTKRINYLNDFLLTKCTWTKFTVLVHTDGVSLASRRARRRMNIWPAYETTILPVKLCLEGVQICSLSTTSFIAVNLNCHRTYVSCCWHLDLDYVGSAVSELPRPSGTMASPSVVREHVYTQRAKGS